MSWRSEYLSKLSRSIQCGWLICESWIITHTMTHSMTHPFFKSPRRFSLWLVKVIRGQLRWLFRCPSILWLSRSVQYTQCQFKSISSRSWAWYNQFNVFSLVRFEFNSKLWWNNDCGTVSWPFSPDRKCYGFNRMSWYTLKSRLSSSIHRAAEQLQFSSILLRPCNQYILFLCCWRVDLSASRSGHGRPWRRDMFQDVWLRNKDY